MQISEKASFDWALVSCAAAAKVDGKKLSKVRVVLGAVAPIPYQVQAAHDFLEGKELSDDVATRAVRDHLEGRQSAGAQRLQSADRPGPDSPNPQTACGVNDEHEPARLQMSSHEENVHPRSTKPTRSPSSREPEAEAFYWCNRTLERNRRRRPTRPPPHLHPRPHLLRGISASKQVASVTRQRACITSVPSGT